MFQIECNHVRESAILCGLSLLLASPIGQSANIVLDFTGNLTSVDSGATGGRAEVPILGNVSGGAYTGSIVYDSSSGIISSGQITFASGYSINNHVIPTPEFAWTEWSWGAVTYALAGTMVTSGNDVSLLIGNALDPSIHTMSSPEVLAMADSTLAPAISGNAPTCDAYDPDPFWQDNNCGFASPANVLGLDSLMLEFSLDTSTHLLGMDDFVRHCGSIGNWDCSAALLTTEWHHMSGSGSLSAVPVPATVWLFGSAIGLLGWTRRKSTFGAGH